MIEKEQIAENKVIVENGEVKTIFSEEIENNGGWMTVDEFCRLMDESINKLEEMINNQNGYKNKQRSIQQYNTCI